MDKRKNNGNKGHSTVSKGIDKRKNNYRGMISEVATELQFKAVFIKLQELAIEGDIAAIKLYVEYTAGKTVQGVDITSGGSSITIPTINFTSSEDIIDIDSEDID